MRRVFFDDNLPPVEAISSHEFSAAKPVWMSMIWTNATVDRGPFSPHEGVRRTSVMVNRKSLLAVPDRPRERSDVQAKPHRATRYRCDHTVPVVLLRENRVFCGERGSHGCPR